MDSDYSDDDQESIYYEDDGGDGFSDGDYCDLAGEDEVKGYLVEDEEKDLERFASICPDVNFSVLKDSEIRERQEAEIRQVSAVLSISREASCVLLRHFNWSISKVHDAWFSDEEGVKKAIGLIENPVVRFPNSVHLDCGICFDTLPSQETSSSACGHPYCKDCWAGYISTAISDGPGCLSLRCPDPSCTAFVGPDMIDLLASHKDKEKYASYFYRSYIEDNKKTKWCPAPGCEYAVNFSGDSENYDVYCHCTTGFCWNCTEDAHRPVDCETVGKWELKNKAESENTNWILVNSKPCPMCKRPIEKNQGCMHMTCRPPCNHHFCWLCLGDWKNHGDTTGGFYACNGFEEAKRNGAINEDKLRRERAKEALGKYTHHYERWAGNESSRKKALKDLKEMKDVKLQTLSDKQSKPVTELMFIIDAWQQIVECRRVLKWTYAYGYYIPEEEKTKKQLFVYMQGQAEAGLERLHQCVEKELEQFLEPVPDQKPLTEFSCFREKLLSLTRVTRNYFENLMTAMKNGLVDVKTHATKPETPNVVVDDSGWYCSRCTLHNDESSTECDACNRAR